jgi:hypothetical protein
VAAAVSLAGGPWSTRRRLCSGSTRSPIVRFAGSEGLNDEMECDVLSAAVMEMMLMRVVRARCKIDVVRLSDENFCDGESTS